MDTLTSSNTESSDTITPKPVPYLFSSSGVYGGATITWTYKVGTLSCKFQDTDPTQTGSNASGFVAYLPSNATKVVATATSATGTTNVLPVVEPVK